MKLLYTYSLFFSFIAFIMLSCHAKNENENRDLIEIIKEKDSTVVYAERLDNEHALLYRSIYPDVLFFVQFSDSVLYEIDSIVDFNHDFTLYKNEDDLKMAMGVFHINDLKMAMGVFHINDLEMARSESEINDLNEKIRMSLFYASTRKYKLRKPLLGYFNERLYIVDYNGFYELSLSRRVFEKVMSYHFAMDLREECSDSNIKRFASPKRIISSSAIKVSFQDGSDFMLSSDGSLNIHVVDTNSCLSLKGSYNNIQIDSVKGDGCKITPPWCP